MVNWHEFNPDEPQQEVTTEKRKHRQTNSDFKEINITNTYREGNKWITFGVYQGQRTYLGRFPSQEMAYEAQQQYKETGVRTNVKKIRKSRFDGPTDDELQELIEEHQSIFPYDKINYVHKYEIHHQVDPNPTNEHYQ